MPMRSTRFTLIRSVAVATLGLLSATALADNGGKTTVYKWVDAQGVVHYSDQPHPNAQKLEIQGAQTYAAPAEPLTPSYATTQAAEPSGSAYQTCVIAQPADQQMLMNVYSATAVVQTSPQLRPGDDVRLFVDGKQMPGSGMSFTFKVYRGQHSVQAIIEDDTGQIVCETSTVTFFVHQPSIQNPHNPVHPR
jgi:hypothetical protein